MSISNDLKYKYARLSVVEKLIVINIIVYVINALLPFLFGLDRNFIVNKFQLPERFSDFITQPWSLITYAFFHGGIWHIFWNMYLLFFFGRMFTNLFGGRRFLNVYFLGLITGGLFFLLSYNIFPVFFTKNSVLIGASAGVMAILVFVCTYIPNQEIRLIFFNIKLWYLAVFFVLLDLVQIPVSNAGGHIAHLGGALLGFMYAKKLHDGKDIGVWFERLVSGFLNLFTARKRSPLKTVHKKQGRATQSKGKNADKNEHQQKIDDILDKISKSGYESLSKEEKDYLFKAGKE
ncbi:rhomboid family intramembrane serine protease [Leptobacterium flavescens]|uniref:Rhomboid family intramembrane serine protease n=1 Tax=Leptobacterium flavescens TaxID=472055 RepID=A0A6P0UI56_9FLAO|nr:rhomboid family intramembrane serine protease [Leptobacterium flavescens]NER12140.1 rhomboid family intramembrane serine protease [Leptobacterium flavescens]